LLADARSSPRRSTAEEWNARALIEEPANRLLARELNADKFAGLLVQDMMLEAARQELAEFWNASRNAQCRTAVIADTDKFKQGVKVSEKLRAKF